MMMLIIVRPFANEDTEELDEVLLVSRLLEVGLAYQVDAVRDSRPFAELRHRDVLPSHPSTLFLIVGHLAHADIREALPEIPRDGGGSVDRKHTGGHLGGQGPGRRRHGSRGR